MESWRTIYNMKLTKFPSTLYFQSIEWIQWNQKPKLGQLNLFSQGPLSIERIITFDCLLEYKMLLCIMQPIDRST